ncbi:helicase C-terminal domain-containing protein [Oscillatoria sp. CS-180]|uniref:helicase C-terminal domain-containing protein n=1 Tax=Oscillatoria sp. CS-180 TaxID=3021720 RepID=UPI00232DB49A|nr:helicase C-terminal domain-containing protein [Oscillatoria sp. CS-180]MDB9529083.1 helicase C-terminal domain-containing protein [Oscillatoria sp. CS-180]
MLEAMVHEQLRAFLRHHGNTDWPHHLTMARLAARALRLGRSSLMQTGTSAFYQGHYRLSYLMSLLMWPEPAILILPETLQQTVLLGDIPRLQEWMPSQKPVHWGEEWPGETFQGLFLTRPEAWLRDRLNQQNRFPAGIPVFIDGADSLEQWIRDCLTVTLDADAWQSLMQAYPQHQALVRDTRVRLTHSIFQHPPNPYQCHLVEDTERQALLAIRQVLLDGDVDQASMPTPWKQFWAQVNLPESLQWVRLNRATGQWTLNCAPIDVAPFIEACWQQQPLVLMGGALDTTTEAIHYRQRLGLGDMTCLKFNPDRQTEEIQLYLPDRIPFPNTAEFQPVLLDELAYLVVAGTSRVGLTVVLVDDTPLKQQVATVLASQFGSRVQVETTDLTENAVLVTGWQFWQEYQTQLPMPTLLVMATLPLPSLEDPLVAGRVAYYKRSRQDWFRLYLLPTALTALQRAIAPVRANQGTVAILDNRVNHRSYGRQILEVLDPAVRFHQRQHLWIADPSSLSQNRQRF